MVSDSIERLHWDEAEPGMMVRLISGGPLMTTEDMQSNGWIMCCWFAGDQVERDTFLPEMLVRAMIEREAQGMGRHEIKDPGHNNGIGEVQQVPPEHVEKVLAREEA